MKIQKIKLSNNKSVVLDGKGMTLSTKKISVDGTETTKNTQFTSAELKKFRALLDEMDL